MSLADDRPRGAETADRALEGLAKGAFAWKRLSPIERAAILRRCMTGVLDVAPEWAALGCRAKGIEPASVLAGEEWLAGPMTTLRGFRLTAETLERVERPVDLPTRTGPGGRTVVSVFPASLLDRLLYLGIEGEVWFAPGSAPTRARIYRDGAAAPAGIAAVLGAGNVSSIAPLDALYMLAAEGQVAVLKLNPVADYLRPVFEHAFKPLIDPGYLAIVSGDGALGDYVCRHPAVSRVHLTGSRRTYDAIMWGAGAEERARAGRPPARRASTSRAPPNSGASRRSSWSRASGPTPTSTSRRGTSPAWSRTTRVSTAWRARCSCWPADGRSGRRSSTVSSVRWRTRRRVLRTIPVRRSVTPGFSTRYPAARAVGPRRQGVVPWTVVARRSAGSRRIRAQRRGVLRRARDDDDRR